MPIRNLEGLKSHIEGKGWQHKQVAAAFIEWHSANTPETVPTPQTVATKLSKLLADEPEGATYFGKRLKALAHALELPEEELAAVLNSNRLLLDPALSPEVVTGLKHQAAGIDQVEFVAVQQEGAGQALREASDRHPRALVVLASASDLGWFEGRSRQVTLVRKLPRGYVLTGAPNLVPLPPPPPPPAWAKEGGLDVPLVAHPDLQAEVLALAKRWNLGPENIWGYSKREPPPGWRESDPANCLDSSEKNVLELARCLFTAKGAEEIPAFPIYRVLPWLATQSGVKDLQLVRPGQGQVLTLTLTELRAGTRNQFWLWDGKLFALGPAAQRIAELLAPLHQVVAPPPSLVALQKALDATNPFGKQVEELVRAVAQETGLGLETELEHWRKSLAAGAVRDSEEVSVLGWNAAEEEKAQAALLELCGRSMTVPKDCVTLPLWLRMAARANLILLPFQSQFDRVHVVLGLGEGNGLRIRLLQFGPPTSGPLALRSARYGGVHYELHGGGTHGWIEILWSERLQGLPLPVLESVPHRQG